MSWDEVAKEMEGVISMMDEDIDDAEEEDEEEKEDKDGSDGEKEEKCDEVERGDETNAGLQSLLLSEILQFRTSQLRRVKMGDEGEEDEGVLKNILESKSLVQNLEEETLTDISHFTTDSSKEAGTGVLVSNQVSHFLGSFYPINNIMLLKSNLCIQTSMPLIVSTSPDINRSGILRCSLKPEHKFLKKTLQFHTRKQSKHLKDCLIPSPSHIISTTRSLSSQ